MWHILLQYNFFFWIEIILTFFFCYSCFKHTTLFRGCQSTLSNWIPMAKLFLYSGSIFFFVRVGRWNFIFFCVYCNFYTCKMKKYFIFHKLMERPERSNDFFSSNMNLQIAFLFLEFWYEILMDVWIKMKFQISMEKMKLLEAVLDSVLENLKSRWKL